MKSTALLCIDFQQLLQQEVVCLRLEGHFNGRRGNAIDI